MSAVGERAIAIVHVGGDTERYVSQWGGSDAVLKRLFETESPASTLVDTHWKRCDTHSGIDFQMFDALYLLTPERFGVSLPLWFGLALTTAEDATRGVLVPVDSLRAVRRCRRVFREFKGVLLDAIDGGSLAPGTADLVLERACELLRTLQLQFRSVPNCYIIDEGSLLS